MNFNLATWKTLTSNWIWIFGFVWRQDFWMAGITYAYKNKLLNAFFPVTICWCWHVRTEWDCLFLTHDGPISIKAMWTSLIISASLMIWQRGGIQTPISLLRSKKLRRSSPGSMCLLTLVRDAWRTIKYDLSILAAPRVLGGTTLACWPKATPDISGFGSGFPLILMAKIIGQLSQQWMNITLSNYSEWAFVFLFSSGVESSTLTCLLEC